MGRGGRGSARRTRPEGSGRGSGRTAKEAAAQRQICFMVLSRRRREDAMRPPPPAPASTGTPEPGALRHRRPGGGRGCGSGSRTRLLHPRPCLLPSLLGASLHPRIPPRSGAPRPNWSQLKRERLRGAAVPPRAQKHPQSRAEHPADPRGGGPGTWHLGGVDSPFLHLIFPPTPLREEPQNAAGPQALSGQSRWQQNLGSLSGQCGETEARSTPSRMVPPDSR